ncbi:MAG: VanZ family protein [Subdoligranulum sp.]|nr:VanZ family protein [Subdoligranulum sp.]
MNKKRLILLFALLLWILFIFSRSLQPAAASTQESDGVRQLLSLLVRHDLSSTFVRKLAHFVEFGVLGVLAACLFAGQAKRSLTALFYSAALGMTVALCDETIQLFVAGRDGRVLDVWLDFAGACTGAAAWHALLQLLRRQGLSARSRAAKAPGQGKSEGGSKSGPGGKSGGKKES